MSAQGQAAAQVQTSDGKRKAPVKTDGPPKRQLKKRDTRLERGEKEYKLPFVDTLKLQTVDFQSALDNAPVYGISEATLNVDPPPNLMAHINKKPPQLVAIPGLPGFGPMSPAAAYCCSQATWQHVGEPEFVRYLLGLPGMDGPWGRTALCISYV
jgi:hypothetical protein